MKYHWKILTIILLIYTLIGGFLMDVPRMPILNETIRALYFHVPMWFAMIVMFFLSAICAIRYLKTSDIKYDLHAMTFATTGLVFGCLGLATGMIWAAYTWGTPWHGDPKQNGSAIALLIYIAYFILRKAIINPEQKARMSTVYNIFAVATIIPLIFILPRMTSSMHPGNGGNPGFNMYDLDSSMRIVFYPAVTGWTLLGIWMSSLHFQCEIIKEKLISS